MSEENINDLADRLQVRLNEVKQKNELLVKQNQELSAEIEQSNKERQELRGKINTLQMVAGRVGPNIGQALLCPKVHCMRHLRLIGYADDEQSAFGKN